MIGIFDRPLGKFCETVGETFDWNTTRADQMKASALNLTLIKWPWNGEKAIHEKITQDEFLQATDVLHWLAVATIDLFASAFAVTYGFGWAFSFNVAVLTSLILCGIGAHLLTSHLDNELGMNTILTATLLNKLAVDDVKQTQKGSRLWPWNWNFFERT